MDWTNPTETPPVWAPPSPAAQPAAQRPVSRSALGGVRRMVATALLAVGLLVVGGVAVVNAADPAASPAPNATTEPSTGNGGVTPPAPRANGAAPNGQRGHDCPNMGGSGSGRHAPALPGSGGTTGPSAGSTGDPSSNL